MGSSRPRRVYRALESGTAEVNVAGPFEPRPVEGNVAQLVVRVMSAYGGWRRRRMTPEKVERARREQEIVKRQIDELDLPDC
jgi:hypothetical protein